MCVESTLKSLQCAVFDRKVKRKFVKGKAVQRKALEKGEKIKKTKKEIFEKSFPSLCVLTE